MGKRVVALGLCLAAVLLWGCGRDVPVTEPSVQETQPTVVTTVPTITQPTQPTVETVPQITEPELPQEPQVLEPVTMLSCTRWVTFPQLLSLGEGKVAASRSYFDKAKNSYVNSLEVLDVYGDTVLHSVLHDGTRELVLQRFPDGHIVTADPAALEYYVYDQSLTLKERFSAPSVEGWFSYDRENLYYLESGVLYRMDVASGNRGRIKLQEDLRFEALVGIHPTEELLVAQVRLSAYTDHCGIAVVDVTNGRLRLLSEKLSHLWLTGDTFYGIAMNDEVYGNDVYIGTLSGQQVSRLTAGQIGDDQMGWSVMPGSHLLVRRFAPDEEPRNTAVFDLKNGTWADLDEHGFVDCAFGATWLYDEQLILGFYEDGDYFYPVLLDPKAMTFQQGPVPETVGWPGLVDTAVIDGYLATVEGPQLDGALEAVRQQADALEEKYDIEVQIAQQTELSCRYAGYSCATVTDPEVIRAALDTLDRELGKYPEGFFGVFRNGAGEGGVCFSLTGEVSGTLPMVGFSRLIRDSYVLGLDITSISLPQTIHHEIWHGVETRLSTDTFDTAAWAACNPSGFRYYGSYDAGYEKLTGWTWSHGDVANTYFVDPYARINGREDRARLWEMVMSIDATRLMEAGAMEQKLSIMVGAMEQVFPGDGLWDTYL